MANEIYGEFQYGAITPIPTLYTDPLGQLLGPSLPSSLAEALGGAEGIRVGAAPLAIASVIPAVLGAAGISVPAALTGIIGAGVAGYGALQALGLGEGGGLFGMNILGGDETMVSGVPLGGPGLAEPPARMVVKEWRANQAQFYLLTDGRIAVYSRTKRRWKVYRPQKMAVIGKNMPSHRNLTRLRRNLKRHTDDAKTILKITSPGSLAKPKRHHYHRRGR